LPDDVRFGARLWGAKSPVELRAAFLAELPAAFPAELPAAFPAELRAAFLVELQAAFPAEPQAAFLDELPDDWCDSPRPVLPRPVSLPADLLVLRCCARLAREQPVRTPPHSWPDAATPRAVARHDSPWRNFAAHSGQGLPAVPGPPMDRASAHVLPAFVSGSGAPECRHGRR